MRYSRKKFTHVVGETYSLKTNIPTVDCGSLFIKFVLSSAMILAPSGALAAEEDMARYHKQMQVLREQINKIQLRYEVQIGTLEQRILELEKTANPHHGHQTLPVASMLDSDENHSQPSALQWSMSGLVTMGGSTAEANELERLQAGTHDPRSNGFTVQALALAVHAELDHNLDATASLVSHIEPDGENIVELEQAFIQTKNIPPGLSAKIGQYFLNFGEENKRHPDDWDFVDTPFLITRLFGGDKLRSQGIQLDWPTPVPWHSTLSLGINNPGGETAASFLYEKGEEVGGHVLKNRDVEGVGDLLYLVKWSHRFPIDSLNRIDFGASGLFGPNATGESTDTKIYGLDFKWTRYDNVLSQQPQFNWRTELMFRHYEAGDNNDPTHEILRDYGIFSQAAWRLNSDWALGLRAEYADGNKDIVNDPLRDSRKRLSMNVTHSLSKLAKLRLQYNRDWADSLLFDNSADSVWLQIVFQAGSHREHE